MFKIFLGKTFRHSTTKHIVSQQGNHLHQNRHHHVHHDELGHHDEHHKVEGREHLHHPAVPPFRASQRVLQDAVPIVPGRYAEQGQQGDAEVGEGSVPAQSVAREIFVACWRKRD